MSFRKENAVSNIMEARFHFPRCHKLSEFLLPGYRAALQLNSISGKSLYGYHFSFTY